jgi:hypothetical protein
MIKPTKYKSISVVDSKLRQGLPVSNEKKQEAITILSKLMEFIKLKYS